MSNKFIKVERNFTVTKALTENGEFEGYASMFDVEDRGGDTVKKGAFKAGLAKAAKDNRKIKMLFNHDRFQPIGVFKEVDEDDKGLYVRGKLTLGVQKADETRLLMLDEAVDSMSIGGYVVKDKVDHKTWQRDLLEIELKEISPVVFPALDAARIVSVKSLPDDVSIGQLESTLRDVTGWSQKDCKRFISLIKSGKPQRDVVGAATISKLHEAINSLKG